MELVAEAKAEVMDEMEEEESNEDADEDENIDLTSVSRSTFTLSPFGRRSYPERLPY